jgi:hypothetical protein
MKSLSCTRFPVKYRSGRESWFHIEHSYAGAIVEVIVDVVVIPHAESYVI